MEIDMTFSIAELFLLVWAIVASLGFGYVNGKYRQHRHITSELLVRIAKGNIQVIETDDYIEFKEV
jgi:hypothetical protein